MKIKRLGRLVLVITSCLLMSAFAFGQVELDEKALIDVKDGISISKDSLFLLNLRFRMQNRIAMFTRSDTDFRPDEFDARVRRLRLRFDGFVLSRKLQYYIQLSFSRADQDLETGTIPQTIRDAILYYTFNKNFYIGFGQSKLPGNRQRVISSGNQQFAERSIVNARYNIDRDFGLFGYYTLTPGEMEIRLKTAVTTGDGRNALAINDGLAYTGRVEWLPFGSFINNGDFSEGDLEFEVRPKASLSATWSYNHKAARTGGQLGAFLPEHRDLNNVIVDFLFKYNGFALSSEYLYRHTDNPFFFTDGGERHMLIVPIGQGINTQISYLLRDFSEFSFRYASVIPSETIGAYDPKRQEYLLGYTKYLNGHRIKAQINGGFNSVDWRGFTPNRPGVFKSQWVFYTQVEFGI